jgi:hypothetical protein
VTSQKEVESVMIMENQLLHRKLQKNNTAPAVISAASPQDHSSLSPQHGSAQGGQKGFALRVWYDKKWLILTSCVVYLTMDSTGVNGPRRLIGKRQYKQANTSATIKATGVCGNVGVNEDGSYAPLLDDDSNDYWPVIPDVHWNCMTRAFVPWNATHEEQHSWCHPVNKDAPTTAAGHLIFVKVHKAASSTLAGVNLRIAQRHGNCSSLQHHQDSRVYRNRNPAKSFMYTSIRHPVHRAISWIFYTSTKLNYTSFPDKNVLSKLKSRYFFVSGTRDWSSRNLNDTGAQVGFMHTGEQLPHALWEAKRPTVVQNFTLALTRVQQVINQYDFIVIVERLSESLVVLQLLLHLTPADILYLSSKKSGGYAFSGKPNPNPGCFKLRKSHISPAVKAYLSSPQWLAQNYQDYLLYKAANASLDRTIDALGRERFDKALAEYEGLMLRAKECEDSAIFPCSDNGTVNEETNCYARDWGCGYPCLDQLADT